MINKPTLIILPGWGGSHETWVDFVEIAKEYFDVQVIDLPCFGDEACPSEVWGVEEYARFAKSKIEIITRHLDRSVTKGKDLAHSNEIPRLPTVARDDVILLGHSFGGQVAVHLTANNPELVDTLILVAAAIVRPKLTIKRYLFGTIASIGKWLFSLPGLRTFEAVAKKILYKAADSPDYTKTSGIQRRIYQRIIRQDQTHLLEGIQHRTLVVWGDKDTVTPIKHGRMIVRLLPNGELRIIRGARHGLHQDNTRDDLVKIVQSFV
jgi:pimeloyl-ACP methyl ester carboxylesterase